MYGTVHTYFLYIPICAFYILILLYTRIYSQVHRVGWSYVTAEINAAKAAASKAKGGSSLASKSSRDRGKADDALDLMQMLAKLSKDSRVSIVVFTVYDKYL